MDFQNMHSCLGPGSDFTPSTGLGLQQRRAGQEEIPQAPGSKGQASFSSPSLASPSEAQVSKVRPRKDTPEQETLYLGVSEEVTWMGGADSGSIHIPFC